MYVEAIAQGTDNFRAAVPTAEARDAAMQWKVMEAVAAYGNATGANPLLNLVDMVILASVSRYVMEDYWVGVRFGESARPLLQTHLRLERDAWAATDSLLTTAQQAELRALLGQWRQQHPAQRYIATLRLPDLAAALDKTPAPGDAQTPGSLFSIPFLDPLAGLDPTTQAIEQTRMLGQSALYYAQRAQILLGWQVELTTYQLAGQPEARKLLTDLDDVAASSRSLAMTAAGIPALVNEQREAAIRQLFAGLQQQQAGLNVLLPQINQALGEGNDMAVSLNAAIKALDALVHPTAAPGAAPPSPGAPFNVLDYGTAASQIAAAARELNVLLASLDKSAPLVARVSQQATLDAKAVVDHAFRLGLLLILALAIVSLVVMYASRRFPPPQAARPD